MEKGERCSCQPGHAHSDSREIHARREAASRGQRETQSSVGVAAQTFYIGAILRKVDLQIC